MGAMHFTPGARVFRFGVFELDTESGELRRHGLRVRLPEQSFQILRTLLMRPGDVVSRDELRQILWPAQTFVDFEVGLNSAVRKLREALDESADRPRFVETVPRRGYRFVAPLIAPAEDVAAIPPADSLSVQTPIGRPERVPRGRALAMLFLVFVGTAALAYMTGRRETQDAAPVGRPIASIVVLPFENLTGDAAQDYLADSVTDAIAAQLAQLEDLDVISRTSARQYKNTVKPLSQIRAELNNVEGIVEGTVQRSGNEVRITAKLIRAESDSTLWADTYNGEMSAMVSLHQEIASDLAAAGGRPRLTAIRAQRVDPRAYEVYLKALSARGLERQEGFTRAVHYLDEAIRIQPDFGAAYAELALTYVQFAWGGPFSPRQVMPKAEVAARKALELDDTLAKAHRALGLVLTLYHWRWEEGDEALERAMTIGGPDESPEAIATSLQRRGLYDEAIAAAERGRRLDPLSFQARMALGVAYRAAGHYERSLAELRGALQANPASNRVHFHIGITLVAMGRLSDAIPELEISGRQATGHNSRMEAYLGYAYAAAGRAADARAVLKELDAHRQDQYVSWYGVALIHDALGEKAQALAALQRAFEDKAVEFAYANQYSPFKTIASEPAFQAIVDRVGR